MIDAGVGGEGLAGAAILGVGVRVWQELDARCTG